MISRRALFEGVAAAAIAVPAITETRVEVGGPFYITEESIVDLRLNREALIAAGFRLCPWQRMWVREA